MQPKFLCSLFVVAFVSGAWATPAAGQQISAPQKQHLRYKLVDLGTFGGPVSVIPFTQRDLNKAGAVAGYAETPIPDPFAPNCASPSCSVQHAFLWRDGVMTELLGFIPNLESGAQAINEAGIVVGEAQNGLTDPESGGGAVHAVLWNKGHLLDLGTLGGASSGALSVNNRGQVVGSSQTAIPDPASGFSQTHGFLWENGAMRDLGTLGGPFSFGTDVNDRGQAGGVSLTVPDPQTGQSEMHAFVWDNGRMTDLTLGGTFSEGTTLNNRGQAVGHSFLPGDLEDHAFLWDGAKTIDLGTLGGTFSLPTGLSEKGNVSGVANTNDEFPHAVLWRNRQIIDLATIPGCSVSWGLNSADQVVGIVLPDPCSFSDARAFLWENGEMVDLNSLIFPASDFKLVYAKRINDAGEIVGAGVPAGVSSADVDTLGHAFVLIPIHEDVAGASVSLAQANSREVSLTATPADAQEITKRVVSTIRSQYHRRFQIVGSASRGTSGNQ
jgi:probable HAF family extracellular repeat protein